MLCDETAIDCGNLHARETKFLQPVHNSLGGRIGINPALIGDNFGAVLHASRQDRTHAIVQIGVITRKRWVASRAHLSGRYGRLRHRFKTQIIEFAFFSIERCRLDPISPPGRA